MISKKALISTGATLATLGGFASLAAGMWGPQPKPPKTVAEAPIVITDVQTIHKTVKVKAKPRPVARPVVVSNTPSSSGTAYTAANTSGDSNASRQAPTVSSHSSGGWNESEEYEGRESEHHDEEREGADD